MNRSEQRVYCWIRQQRYILAVHKYIYHVLDDQILEDLQYDYIKKRLEVVEQKWPEVAYKVSDKGYSPPKYYADAITFRFPVERKALSILHRWERGGRHTVDNVRFMNGDISKLELYRDALRIIVRYPIGHF